MHIKNLSLFRHFYKIILTANQVNEFRRLTQNFDVHWKVIPVIQLLYRSDLLNKISISEYQLSTYGRRY
jgi:hypothetical protein